MILIIQSYDPREIDPRTSTHHSHLGQRYHTKDVVTIDGLHPEFIPSDELEYVNYLKLILGRHDESTSLSPAFTELASKIRPSFANALDQVALVFVPYA